MIWHAAAISTCEHGGFAGVKCCHAQKIKKNHVDMQKILNGLTETTGTHRLPPLSLYFSLPESEMNAAACGTACERESGAL